MSELLIPLVCFVPFLFLLLVSISVPTVKTIYLISIYTTGTPSLRINFGVWGYCIPSEAYCSPAHLGWTFDGKVASYL
jgi:hypothetical protein